MGAVSKPKSSYSLVAEHNCLSHFAGSSELRTSQNALH